VVVPIIAASGLKIPKTSSRAITGAAGTADLMEVLAPVNFSASEVQQMTQKVGGTIVWGGATNIAPADDKIIIQEYPFKIDARGQMLASVMAKKLEIKTLETATERLGIEKSMAGQSDTQVQLALRYYDLQQAILDKKEKGLETDQQIYDFAIASMNNIQAEEANTRAQNTFQAGWNKAYNNFVERSQDSAALGAEAFSTMFNGMSSALDRFVETGKLSFGSLVSDMIKGLLKLQLQSQMSGLFGMLGGGGGGFGLFSSSTDFNNGAGLLGGFFADGGEPPVGVPSIVGERGAELFVPRTAGTIIPNNQLSSMMGGQPQTVYNGTVIQNMSAIDTQSGVQFLAKNKNAIFAANQSAQRGLPQSR
jgi:phage-related minor tail protein